MNIIYFFCKKNNCGPSAALALLCGPISKKPALRYKVSLYKRVFQQIFNFMPSPLPACIIGTAAGTAAQLKGLLPPAIRVLEQNKPARRLGLLPAAFLCRKAAAADLMPAVTAIFLKPLGKIIGFCHRLQLLCQTAQNGNPCLNILLAGGCIIQPERGGAFLFIHQKSVAWNNSHTLGQCLLVKGH